MISNTFACACLMCCTFPHTHARTNRGVGSEAGVLRCKEVADKQGRRRQQHRRRQKLLSRHRSPFATLRQGSLSTRVRPASFGGFADIFPLTISSVLSAAGCSPFRGAPTSRNDRTESLEQKGDAVSAVRDAQQPEPNIRQLHVHGG